VTLRSNQARAAAGAAAQLQSVSDDKKGVDVARVASEAALRMVRCGVVLFCVCARACVYMCARTIAH
jgi:hypothetical protein